jgi:hypothetical protein
MTPEEISQLAFLLYPHLVRSKPDATSAESLAQRIKGMQEGLQPEDEFAATVGWLGNCAAIHRIDQTPMPFPPLTEKMQAPDFIAFPMVCGRPSPVLIEVKSHNGEHLDWSEKYLNSLRKFAECLNLPLLVAWKCGALWFLVDHSHFEKNVTAYRLQFRKAIQQDLYCVLFRNLRVHMNPALEFILEMKIIDEVAGEKDTLLPEGPYQMEIAYAGFYRGGQEIKDYDHKFSWLFYSTPDKVEFRRTGKQTCQQVFRPLPDHSFTLSNVLTTQLSMTSAGESVDWHRIMRDGKFASSGREFRAILRGAIDKGFVQYVFDIIPKTWPGFLPDEKKVMAGHTEYLAQETT